MICFASERARRVVRPSTPPPSGSAEVVPLRVSSPADRASWDLSLYSDPDGCPDGLVHLTLRQGAAVLRDALGASAARQFGHLLLDLSARVERLLLGRVELTLVTPETGERPAAEHLQRVCLGRITDWTDQVVCLTYRPEQSARLGHLREKPGERPLIMREWFHWQSGEPLFRMDRERYWVISPADAAWLWADRLKNPARGHVFREMKDAMLPDQAVHVGLPLGTVVLDTITGHRLQVDACQRDFLAVHRIRKDGRRDRRYAGWSGRLPKARYTVEPDSAPEAP